MTRLRWYGHTDLEICIMSARSAQRTRRRRWRMGRDIAGEREMRRTHGRRVSGLEALVVEGEQRRLLLLKKDAVSAPSSRSSRTPCAIGSIGTFPPSFFGSKKVRCVNGKLKLKLKSSDWQLATGNTQHPGEKEKGKRPTN